MKILASVLLFPFHVLAFCWRLLVGLTTGCIGVGSLALFILGIPTLFFLPPVGLAMLLLGGVGVLVAAVGGRR